MMDQLIRQFPEQLREALSIGAAASIRPLDRPVHQILVTGMGGSGIGAEFVEAFIREECRVPLLVVKDYDLPAYVSEHTLLIASSYSGYTEETLSACRQGQERGARIIAITSGGELEALAGKHGWDLLRLPKGQPAPRACLGYSMVAQLYVLRHLDLISHGLLEQISAVAGQLESMQEEIHEKARQLAGFLLGKTPVLYSTRQLAPVALRFRQQLAENAKMLSWHHLVPEMNHNELVGWRRDQPELAALFLRHAAEQERNALRMNFTREVVSEFAGARLELYGKGENLVEQSFYLVHLLDWVSWYLAEMQGMDAMEIRIIDYLKEEMARARR
jgi:glucose/mannose-6-phosphate isomerase